MIIYPAIDIKDGRVVQLVGGDPDQVAVEADTPQSQARRWRKAGAKWVHVVDLDAALGKRNQWLHLGKVLGEGVQVQFGGGVRHMKEIQHLLDLGVGRVIVGTQGVQHPEWTRELGTVFPDQIILAVDARGRDVQTHGWTKGSGTDVVELVRSLDDAGLAGFLFTDVDKEGRMEGIDQRVIQDLRDAARKTALIISGGIGTEDDLDTLEGLGVDGVVLGMSIYTGKIDLEKVLRTEVTQ